MPEFSDLSEQDLLAACIWGEARGEPRRGKIAVANVVFNRINHPNRWGNTIHSVCLQRWQFSCFNENDPNSEVIKEGIPHTVGYLMCSLIASMAIDGELADVTQTYPELPGATHYHNSMITPDWSTKLQYLTQIGKHKFYREA